MDILTCPLSDVEKLLALPLRVRSTRLSRSLRPVLRELRSRRDALVTPYLTTVKKDVLSDADLAIQCRYIELAAIVAGLVSEFGDPEGLC